MKINIRQLKKMIRETINETIGTSGTRGGVAVPGDANPHSRDVWFPGHDNEYPVIRQGFDDDEQSPQGLGTPNGEYVAGVGWVDDDGNIWHNTYNSGTHASDDEGDAIDDSMKDGGRSESEFFMVIDSQVTRGKGGEIRHPSSNNSFSVQEDKASGTLAGDLYWLWQKASAKSAKNRCIDVIETLMKYDVVQESTIDDQLIEEYGIKGKDSNKIYGILDYFEEYNNGIIKEAKKRERLLKRRRRSRL